MEFEFQKSTFKVHKHFSFIKENLVTLKKKKKKIFTWKPEAKSAVWVNHHSGTGINWPMPFYTSFGYGHNFPYLSQSIKTGVVFTLNYLSLFLLFISCVCSVWEWDKPSQFLIPFFSVQTAARWGIVWDIHNHSSTLKFKHLKITLIQHLINISSFEKILKFNPTVKSQHLTEDKIKKKDIFLELHKGHCCAKRS